MHLMQGRIEQRARDLPNLQKEDPKVQYRRAEYHLEFLNEREKFASSMADLASLSLQSQENGLQKLYDEISRESIGLESMAHKVQNQVPTEQEQELHVVHVQHRRAMYNQSQDHLRYISEARERMEQAQQLASASLQHRKMAENPEAKQQKVEQQKVKQQEVKQQEAKQQEVKQLEVKQPDLDQQAVKPQYVEHQEAKQQEVKARKRKPKKSEKKRPMKGRKDAT